MVPMTDFQIKTICREVYSLLKTAHNVNHLNREQNIVPYRNFPPFFTERVKLND